MALTTAEVGVYGEPCLFSGRAKLLGYDAAGERWTTRGPGTVYLEERASDGTVTCCMHDAGTGDGGIRLRPERTLLNHIVHPETRFGPTTLPASVMFRTRDHAKVRSGEVGFFLLVLREGQQAADDFEAAYTGAVQRMGQAFGADGSQNGGGGRGGDNTSVEGGKGSGAPLFGGSAWGSSGDSFNPLPGGGGDKSPADAAFDKIANGGDTADAGRFEDLLEEVGEGFYGDELLKHQEFVSGGTGSITREAFTDYHRQLLAGTLDLGDDDDDDDAEERAEEAANASEAFGKIDGGSGSIEGFPVEEDGGQFGAVSVSVGGGSGGRGGGRARRRGVCVCVCVFGGVGVCVCVCLPCACRVHAVCIHAVP